jgi:DNA-binding HxlR family transcriptional regulator
MVAPRGSLQMLALADVSPMSFADFTKISIGEKKLSSATVSKRLKEMLILKVLSEEVLQSKNGRRIIGYRTTERGKRILALIEELRETMREANVKPFL